MGRIENLKRQATEAAESEFLWNLGYLAPSRHKAHDVCVAWGLSNEDQKRVTAVTALRDQASEILSEIRDDAAFDEEEEMVDVVLGEKHYEKIAERKDRKLWEGIFRSLGIPCLLEKEDIKIENVGLRSLLQKVQKKVPRMGVFQRAAGNTVILVVRPNIYYNGVNWKASTSNEWLIRIRPSGITGGEIQTRERHMSHVTSFYQVRERYWINAAVFVEDKSALTLAKKIADAYEAAVRRRIAARRPALQEYYKIQFGKVVVVKNY